MGAILQLLSLRITILSDVEIHRSARKHGIDDITIRRALEHAITVVDLEPDADPPTPLAIGPDPAGHLLEITGSSSTRSLVIHVMPLRPQFYDLLPQTLEDLP
jgi:hypothetical protein